MNTLSYLVGDATDPHHDGTAVIAHIGNNKGGWGKGFSGALSRRWPLAERYYRDWHRHGRAFNPPFELGEVQLLQVTDELWVATMIAQDGYRSAANPVPLDLTALRRCLRTLADEATRLPASVHAPRIGTGLGGGDWNDIEPLIGATLLAAGVPTTVYDLPPAGRR